MADLPRLHDEIARTAERIALVGAAIIDREGIIRHKHIGPLTVDSLNNEILPLIAELQSTP